MMTQRRHLRDQCLNALSNYMHQAQKTCELLGDLESETLSIERLLAILEQTQLEDEVQQSYMALRQRLFEVLSGTRVQS